MLTIFAMSSIPGHSDMLAILVPKVQNFLHVPLYGFLAFLWIITFKLWMYSEKRSVGIATIISVNFGFFDENYQYYVPGRYMSFIDIFFDLIGVLSAVGFYKLVFKRHILNFEPSIN